MSDKELAAKIDKIKDMRPVEPGGFNCIDFSLGSSGYGVRVMLTCPEDEWILSTSIGSLTPGKYTPMPLDDWTAPLRKAATGVVDEVLEHFNVDQDSKRVVQSHTIVVFRFKEETGER